MKQLIPCGDKVPLYKLPVGSLFAHGDDCIAMKSEYMSNNGLIEAYILGSGELFWGGAKTVEEQRYIMVQPLDIVEAGEDAVPVVHGRWVTVSGLNQCSNCGTEFVHDSFAYCPYCDSNFKYCPVCGAKMDGGNEE